MTDRNLPRTVTEVESETLDLRDERRTFNAGQVVGDRYQILALLGRGGMGEVWHAFDLKLRVEVALKALRSDIFKNERRRESLRQEVRSARDVVSPNVCRLYDLHELEGLELVSMEFVDGQTLLEVMRERAPLDLQEAQDIASQFLAGLEAIHQIGLVHRDIKPENIMLTRAGRVVVMDFGIAREEHEGSGTVSGTAAYMAPEQAAGQSVDARADLYSAGIVLAEMVNPEGLKDRDSRESVWEAVRAEPAKIPDSPWAQVITKAVAKDRENRFNTANDLTRALEKVTLRVVGADDLHPYPGLAAFTEDDAEYFFGREAEVEQMWRRLDRPHLLAVTGPSGAGKTSFLRAGLIPSAGSDWSILRCTPGTSPFTSLGQALAREMAGDVKAVEILASGHQPDALVTVIARWRNRHKNALLIVDQFEELFTLSPIEVQRDFSDLLGRLAVDADTFVLLSLRDDFLLRCREHEALASLFTDLTALIPPTGGALRRAMVQPATKCGYRFEDDQLIEDMIAEVEGERGALPLLAFALARLWEQRDRATGFLTRLAYDDIGGVGGALAQHAEATIDRIGTEHIVVVREIFRNLVTAEGTRAVREWDELLSVFDGDHTRAGIKPAPTSSVGEGFIPSRDSASTVLHELIDSRLLTSYEVREGDEEPTRRVEIIHESLLANWPRLVRWQTHDQEGAQLRDELRQAARSWDEHGRHDDRLWTGTAFREYQLWRERYPGSLTETEDAFAEATTSLATRRRRRRRLVAGAGIAVLLTALAMVTGLWRQSLRQTRIAQASKLITLGHIRFGESRTDALAYSIAALERADTTDARQLAIKALWAGPPATVLPADPAAWSIAFAPDGNLMIVGHQSGGLRVYPRDGGPPIELDDFEGKYVPIFPSFSPDGSRLVSGASRANGELRLWNTDDWRIERILQTAEFVEGVGARTFLQAVGFFEPEGESLLSLTWKSDTDTESANNGWITHRWPRDGGDPQFVDEIGASNKYFALHIKTDAFVVSSDPELHLHQLSTLGHTPPRVIFRHPETLNGAGHPVFDSSGRRMAMCDAKNRLFVWRIDSDDEPLILKAPPGDPMTTAFSPDGSFVAQVFDPGGGVLWDLEGPAGGEPLSLDGTARLGLAFSPDGRWLAAASGTQTLALWPMTQNFNRILRGHDGAVESIEFAGDSSCLYTQGKNDGKVLAWPLTGDGVHGEPIVVHHTPKVYGTGLAVDPLGRFLIVAAEEVMLQVPLDGGPEVSLGRGFYNPRLDQTGRYLAAKVNSSPTAVVFDLETDRRWELTGPGDGDVFHTYFDPDGKLLATRGGILSRWDPETHTTERLFEDVAYGYPHPDGRLFTMTEGKRWLVDLQDGSRTRFPVYGSSGSWVISPSGSIVAKGCLDGSVLAWSVAEQTPHLLLGHEGRVHEPRISPNGKWIASHGVDETVRLWPVPDLTKPALYDLPHRELLAKLKSLTNLRVVADETSYSGYKVQPDFDAYHGWAKVPEW